MGNIALFKFIDPGAADLIHEEIMIASKEMLENFVLLYCNTVYTPEADPELLLCFYI